MEINGLNITEKEFDVVIVGGGGSGLRASLEIAKSGLKVAVVSKVFPTRSHTVAAQGGITCAIASADPNDDWRWSGFIGLETRLLPNPLRTLSGDSTLRQLVFELYLKLGTIKTLLSLRFRNIKLPSLFSDIVDRFIGYEGGRGEDKFQNVDLGKLLFERFVCIDGKCGSSDL
jgi:hypothetical protein